MIIKIKRTLIGILAILLIHIEWNDLTDTTILDSSMSFIGGFLIGHLAVNFNLNN